MSTGSKVSFYARDPAQYTNDVADKARRKYMDEERRCGSRRKHEERRKEVRFELKDDRRQNSGRRETDQSLKFW